MRITIKVPTVAYGTCLQLDNLQQIKQAKELLVMSRDATAKKLAKDGLAPVGNPEFVVKCYTDPLFPEGKYYTFGWKQRFTEWTTFSQITI